MIKSKGVDVEIGVPQGSILGSILFFLCVNDLPIYLNNYFTTMYADDTCIVVHSDDEGLLQDKCNELFIVLRS